LLGIITDSCPFGDPVIAAVRIMTVSIDLLFLFKDNIVTTSMAKFKTRVVYKKSDKVLLISCSNQLNPVYMIMKKFVVNISDTLISVRRPVTMYLLKFLFYY